MLDDSLYAKAGIKHKKAIVDAKCGKVWTKIVREITIAANIKS